MRLQGHVGLVLGCLAACCAWTQTDASLNENQFTIEISPKFVTAYREDAWVPVDVLVGNNRSDLSGFVEVSTVSAMGKQSPVYAIAAESPKGSRKRFRVYCHLYGTTELQAAVYQKRWRMVDLPLKIPLRPIANQDLLILTLDDDAPAYGFLYSAVQPGGANRGVHRIDLLSSELDQLPEQYSCYEAYDAVVLGKTDPGAISAERRELLRRYVENGGVVIICTGEYAPRYQGTWVEELAGIRIGNASETAEKSIADAVFSEDERAGARADKVLFATLTPTAPEVRVRGRKPVLATLRPIGKGSVAVIAVDATSGALQQSPAYLAVWKELCERRERQAALNSDGALRYFAQSMPTITGVRIYPRSSVMLFLGLYICVGVVGNWLFWNFLKRREMAWVCLVIFAVGFTGYALVFGTAGRAKSTELQQLDIVRIPQAGNAAKLEAVTGVLAARTTQFTFELAHPNGLVTEVEALGQPYTPRPFSASFTGTNRPSRMMSGTPPRLEDFAVGASVLRVFEVMADVPKPGGIHGVLTRDAQGLHGTLTNSSDWTIDAPALVYRGRVYPLRGSKQEWTVDLKQQQLATPIVPPTDISQIYYGVYGRVGPSPDASNRMVETFLRLMLTDSTAPDQVESNLPPMFCGRVQKTLYGGVVPQGSIGKGLQASLVFADVEVVYRDVQEPVSAPLMEILNQPTPPVQGRRTPAGLVYGPRGGMGMRPLNPGTPRPFNLAVPSSLAKQPNSKVYVDLTWQADAGQVLYIPKGAPLTWPGTHVEWTSGSTQGRGTPNVTIYRVDDWQQYYDSKKQILEGVVAATQREGWANCSATGRIEYAKSDEQEGWLPWQ